MVPVPVAARALDPSQVLLVGLELMGFSNASIRRRKLETLIKDFEADFGPHPYHVAQVWNDMLTTNIPAAAVGPEGQIKHLLMGLHWLRCYKTNKQHKKSFNIDGKKVLDTKTVRKWTEIYVKKIAALKQLKIIWPDDNDWGGSIFIISVDGTHCPILEPVDKKDRKNKKWYSHKTNGPAQNWEVALHLWESKVVWVKGSGPAGAHGDMDVFYSELGHKIPVGKKVIGDKGYRGEPEVITVANSFDSDEVRNFKNRARARQEAFNSKLKKYNCLSHKFRHKFAKQFVCFDAVAVLCQYEMEGPAGISKPLFDV